MAFAFVRTATNTNTLTTSCIVTPSLAFSLSNLVVVFMRYSSTTATVSSVVDNVGNTYLQATSPVVDAIAGITVCQYYGVQVTGGASNVTVTYNTAVSSRVFTEEFSGGATSNAAVFDKGSTGVSGGTGTSSASVTAFAPLSAGQLIVAGIGFSANVSAITAGTSYVLGNTTSTASVTEYRLSGTTNETAPISWTTAARFGEIASTYKLASTASSFTGVASLTGVRSITC